MEHLTKLHSAGMEIAAIAWEAIENVDPPLDPVNIFKAASSIRCTEMMERFFGTEDFGTMADIVIQFIENTRSDIGGAEAGNFDESVRAVGILGDILSDSESDNPADFAIRQHAFDGLLLLAAARLGKEIAIKERIDQMQESLSKMLLNAAVRRGRQAWEK